MAKNPVRLVLIEFCFLFSSEDRSLLSNMPFMRMRVASRIVFTVENSLTFPNGRGSPHSSANALTRSAMDRDWYSVTSDAVDDASDAVGDASAAIDDAVDAVAAPTQGGH